MSKTISSKTLEEVIRKHVRKALNEIMPKGSAALSYSGDLGEPDAEDLAQRSQASKRDTFKSLGGATFSDIGKEIGATPQTAQNVLNKSLEKFKSLYDIPVKELDDVVNKAVDDYIDHLASSGEIDIDDVMLLNSHPNIVASLDDFREDFLPPRIQSLVNKYKGKKLAGKIDVD